MVAGFSLVANAALALYLLLAGGAKRLALVWFPDGVKPFKVRPGQEKVSWVHGSTKHTADLTGDFGKPYGKKRRGSIWCFRAVDGKPFSVDDAGEVLQAKSSHYKDRIDSRAAQEWAKAFNDQKKPASLGGIPIQYLLIGGVVIVFFFMNGGF